jgi:hypothetical protein
MADTFCGTGTGNFPQPGDPDLNNSTLIASPAFGGIDVVWTYPELNSHAVAFIKLYRSTNADPATRVFHRRVTGEFYYDKVNPSQNIEYFYWIEIVSVNGTVGDLIGPASAVARPTIEQTMQMLTGQIDDSLLGQALRGEIQRMDSITAALDDETSSRWDQYTQLQTDLGTYQNDLDGVATLIADEVVRLDSSDTAQVNQINVISTKSDDNAAAIVAEQIARSDADSALAYSINTVEGSVANNAAAIQTEQTARVEDDTALAQDITTLQTTVNDDIAQVELNAQTQIDTFNGEVTAIGALYTAKVNVNGLIGGFGVYNDGSEVLAGFDVDTFFVGRTQANKVKPFVIKDGETFIDEAVIKSLTFNKLRADDGSFIVEDGKLKASFIDAGSLTVNNLKSSSNVSTSKGWQPRVEFNSNGSYQINAVTSQGRVEQDINGIRVYDSAGAIRVELGKLS